MSVFAPRHPAGKGPPHPAAAGDADFWGDGSAPLFAPARPQRAGADFPAAGRVYTSFTQSPSRSTVSRTLWALIDGLMVS